MNKEEKLIPGEKYKPNYRYQVSATIQVESRKAYIKNLKAMALYMEENITDESFHEMALKKEPFPQLNTYRITDIEPMGGTGKLHRYEISLIPNYGNEEIIIKTTNELGISNTGKTRESGFYGCDVPVILDIECTEEDRDLLNKHLRAVATDTFDIVERCFACGNLM